ncbi:uncharacterized protein TNCV_4868231 [Trichonephila clavipes]|nr:uncharacterized protein TNCV_4868231 [Trichonephila clavipes]
MEETWTSIYFDATSRNGIEIESRVTCQIQDAPAQLIKQENSRMVHRWLSASSVERLANQRLYLGRDEVSDWLYAQCSTLTVLEGCGSPVVKASNHGRHVMRSIPVPLKTRRVGQRCTLNLSRAETSSRWCGVVVRRGGCQLRCRPRHLTMVQNYVVRRQKPSCS